MLKAGLFIHTALFLFILVHGNISPQIVVPKDNSKDEKFPPCKTCKLYVESFLKGIEKTAKGNFAGGDTAWEEEKLKNYATSEVRLVEIQEKMCLEISGFQDQCHDFAAEIESDIEDWWFKHQHSKAKDSDLHTWLCINKAKKCCPIDHFGPECKPCMGFPNVCFGNGKCKGNGTRKGNGQCACNKGFTGELCKECSSGYFQSYQDDKTILCSKCHGSCLGDCSGGGPKGCSQCNSGWLLSKDFGCFDINECATEDICTSNEFCVNTEGSYRCMPCDPACTGCHGDGPDMCLKCAEDYRLMDNICISTNAKTTGDSNEDFYRYFVYLGLCVSTYIIFQKNVMLASLVGVVVAVYMSLSEYVLSDLPAALDPAASLAQQLLGKQAD